MLTCASDQLRGRTLRRIQLFRGAHAEVAAHRFKHFVGEVDWDRSHGDHTQWVSVHDVSPAATRS
jgi:hypothetical protein